MEEFVPEMQSFIPFPRDDKAGGDGVTYAKFLTVTNSVFGTHSQFESLAVQLKNTSKNSTLTTVYRRPSCQTSDVIEEI